LHFETQLIGKEVKQTLQKQVKQHMHARWTEELVRDIATDLPPSFEQRLELLLVVDARSQRCKVSVHSFPILDTGIDQIGDKITDPLFELITFYSLN
jgi:hypothetical protein